VDSGSASDGDGEYRERAAGSHWADERPGSQPSFDEYRDRLATRRHRYDSWYERQRRADSDVTAHLPLGGVTERQGDEAAEQIDITRYHEVDDDDERQRRATSPVDRRRGVDCASLYHYAHLQHVHSDPPRQHDMTAVRRSPSRADHGGINDRQDAGVTQSRSRSLSPMSPPPPPPLPPASFNPPAEFRSPTTAAPPLPPGPLSHELVRHLREQQVLRLAAVSRAIHHQLRYLHHGSSGGAATSPSSSAGLYPPLHRHHQFDASLLLGSAGAAASYTLHDSIMPGFHTPDLALTSGRDSPGDSDVSNDNVSGMLF